MHDASLVSPASCCYLMPSPPVPPVPGQLSCCLCQTCRGMPTVLERKFCNKLPAKHFNTAAYEGIPYILQKGLLHLGTWTDNQWVADQWGWGPSLGWGYWNWGLPTQCCCPAWCQLKKTVTFTQQLNQTHTQHTNTTQSDSLSSLSRDPRGN